MTNDNIEITIKITVNKHNAFTVDEDGEQISLEEYFYNTLVTNAEYDNIDVIDIKSDNFILS
ncbi:MAG: hypothetical protein ACKO96_05000 [Flammeovirgaceae bacterium]